MTHVHGHLQELRDNRKLLTADVNLMSVHTFLIVFHVILLPRFVVSIYARKIECRQFEFPSSIYYIQTVRRKRGSEPSIPLCVCYGFHLSYEIDGRQGSI